MRFGWCHNRVVYVDNLRSAQVLGSSDYKRIKISSLILKMLLQNLPRLGGYTQRVRPRAQPVRDLQQLWKSTKSTERPRPGPQGSTRPTSARGLDRGRSIYLPAEWGPCVRVITLLGDSATTTRRAGTRLYAKRISSRSG